VLDEKKSWADIFWHQQKEEYSEFRADKPGDPAAVEPPDTEDGGCVFSYSPSESAKDYRDALWIQAFNSAPVGYIDWDNTDPMNPHRSISGAAYVTAVCHAIE